MITTSRLQVTGVTGGPLRITGASLVNGAYELATAGGADYELQTERQTTMDNILFIPGIANPVSEINSLLFGQGQQGTFIAPSLTASLISGSTFGTGVETLPDLSPRNNPFSQATPASRGAWFREPKTGRRNFIQRPSESLATWAFTNVSGTASITGNNVVFGASAIDRVIAGTATTVSGLQYTASATVFGSGQIRLFVVDGNGSTPTALTINLTPTPTRHSLTFTSAASGSSGGLGLYNNGSATPTSFTFVNAQFEQGSSMTAYQRRGATDFDVTEQGQRDCYGVRADGIDDFYQRAIDFSGTDKVTVFAAVRKLSDAATAVFLELSPSASTNNGGFALLAPSASGSERYTFNSRGTASAFAITSNSAFNAPVTNIVTCIGDIANDLCILRVDGTQVAAGSSDQGTGNYRNDTLNLFRRNGATLPFNGNLYGLIVAGGSYPLSTIQRVERILSRITPTVNL